MFKGLLIKCLYMIMIDRQIIHSFILIYLFIHQIVLSVT